MTAGRLKIWNDLAGEWQYTPGGGSQPDSRPLDVVADWDTPGIVAETTPFPITALDQGAHTFTIAGDHTAIFLQNSAYKVSGSTGNDGVYNCQGSVLDTGSTVVTVGEDITSPIADGNLNGVTGGGIIVFTPVEGEWCEENAGLVRVPVAFDGTTPKLHFGYAANPRAYDQAGFIAHNVDLTVPDTPFPASGDHVFILTQDSVGGGLVFADTEPVVVCIDDGSGGDPGNGQGQVIVQVPVWAPPQ